MYILLVIAVIGLIIGIVYIGWLWAAAVLLGTLIGTSLGIWTATVWDKRKNGH